LTVRRASWRIATVTALRRESATSRTLVLDVPDWPGHLAGQHVDVRLTAEDGYSTQRSYSIAAPWRRTQLELTVENVRDGEVSPYLTEVVEIGDELELRGPIGGWFVWSAQQAEPVLLLAGGSGVVPLMAMVREHADQASTAPFRLVYSTRSAVTAIYRDELERAAGAVLQVDWIFTRQAPTAGGRSAGRLSAADLLVDGWLDVQRPAIYVCGPSGFVESAATLLIAAGHEPGRIKTERFGPTGDQR